MIHQGDAVACGTKGNRRRATYPTEEAEAVEFDHAGREHSQCHLRSVSACKRTGLGNGPLSSYWVM